MSPILSLDFFVLTFDESEGMFVLGVVFFSRRISTS